MDTLEESPIVAEPSRLYRNAVQPLIIFLTKIKIKGRVAVLICFLAVTLEHWRVSTPSGVFHYDSSRNISHCSRFSFLSLVVHSGPRLYRLIALCTVLIII